MIAGDVAIICTVVIGFALVSRLIKPTVASGPMVFVAAGLLCGPQLTDAVDLGLEVEAVSLIGEATLAIVLFSDATRINVNRLRRYYSLPARLLGIGLPLTVALGTVAVKLVITGIGWWEAALIAAILAPTDAALGQEVVADPTVPASIRQGLNVESGMNDGLVVPAVTLFTVLATGEEDSGDAAFWTRFMIEQVGIGILVGIAVGIGGAWLLAQAERRDWVDGIYAQLATFMFAILAFSTSTAFDGNGFIAAFVAGIAFGRVSVDPEGHDEYTEDTAALAAGVSFFLFGNVLLGPALEDVTGPVFLSAILSLTLVRMIPVAIAMIGSDAAPVTVAFIGWFGPRGLASILFGLLMLEEELPKGEEFFSIVAWTVLMSVFLHGATAAWGARSYGRWWADMSPDERESMPESAQVPEMRVGTRFATRTRPSD